jgi:hypothetical protein
MAHSQQTTCGCSAGSNRLKQSLSNTFLPSTHLDATVQYIHFMEWTVPVTLLPCHPMPWAIRHVYLHTLPFRARMKYSAISLLAAWASGTSM